MPLATAQSLEENLPILPRAASYAMKRVAAAEREMRDHLGDKLYGELEGDTTHKHHAAAEEAESLLVLYYALPVMNLSVQEDGEVIRSTGFDQSREELMSHDELEAYRTEIYQQAMTALPSVAAGERDEPAPQSGGAFASVMG